MKFLTHTTAGLFIALIVLFLSPLLGITESSSIVHAQDGDSYQFLAPIGGLGDDAGDGNRTIDVSSDDSFPDYVQTMITIVIGFAIMAAILLIIGAGFQYMTSVSEGGKSEAKERISRSIMGLVLALASVVILQTINPNLIELNSVENVYVTGGEFSDVDPTINQEFGGSVHLPDDDAHGNKFCMFIDGEWNISDFFGFDDDDDRYICYETKKECEVGEEKAKEAEGEGGSGVEISCEFYYKSLGEVVYEPDNEKLKTVVGVSDVSDTAKWNCTVNAENFVKNKQQCNYQEGSQFTPSSSDCEIECEDPFSKPDPIPESWGDNYEWCSVNEPDQCWNNRTTCNSATRGECEAKQI